MLDPDPMYLSLADTEEKRQKVYRDFIASEQDKNIFDLIRKSIANDSILGEDNFIDKLREKLALSKSRRRGRPKKNN